MMDTVPCTHLFLRNMSKATSKRALCFSPPRARALGITPCCVREGVADFTTAAPQIARAGLCASRMMLMRNLVFSRVPIQFATPCVLCQGRSHGFGHCSAAVGTCPSFCCFFSHEGAEVPHSSNPALATHHSHQCSWQTNWVRLGLRTFWGSVLLTICGAIHFFCVAPMRH